MKSQGASPDGAEPSARAEPGSSRSDGLTVIPAIDLLEGRVVRLREGDFDRRTFYKLEAAAYARRWTDEGATRLHLVDLEGAVAGRPVQESVIRHVIEASTVPCGVAGGIRS